MKTNSFKKTYDKDFNLRVDKLSFERGKVYCLIGSNGSGKSTFAKLLSRIEVPDKKESVWEKGKGYKITYVPQQSYVFSLSTYKNIMLSLGKNTDKEYMNSLIEALDLKGHINKNAKKLSGGEVGKMILIRALLKPADILILDEPMASLDIYSVPAAEKAIKGFVERNNAAVIMITHSMKQALRFSDEILFFSKGRIVETGEPDEIFNNPKSKELSHYLEYNVI